MTTLHKPVISQWYRHLDKGQQFYVTAIDDALRESTIDHPARGAIVLRADASSAVLRMALDLS